MSQYMKMLGEGIRQR